MSLNNQSCLDCPSFMDVQEARDFFDDQTIRVPMCARMGYLFAEPQAGVNESDASENATDHYPSVCGFHGEARPSIPIKGSVNPVLYMPDTAALTKITNDKSCTDCFQCKNLFWDSDRDVYGCKPRAVVVWSGLGEVLADDCSWADSKGPLGIPNVKGTKLQAPFGVPVTIKPRQARKPAAAAPSFVTTDPRTRDSDAPVRPEDVGKIRAYEKISGPKQDYYLPIFDTDYFDEADREKIPTATGDGDDPSLYVDYSGLVLKFMVESYALDMTMTLVGEPGSGKTTGVRHLAWRMNMPFTLLTFNEFTDPEEIFGQMQASNGSTYAAPGELPQAWIKPGVILSDEWNLGQDGIQQGYRSMNDASRIIKFYGRTYSRHADCFHLAAINPSHDVLNIGAKELASADVRRLSFHFMPVVDKATQKVIINEAIKRIHQTAVSGQTLDTILKISDDLKEMVKQGKLPHHWPLSQDLKVAMLSLHFPLMDAYKAAYFDYIDPDIAEVALATIKSHIPYGVD